MIIIKYLVKLYNKVHKKLKSSDNI